MSNFNIKYSQLWVTLIFQNSFEIEFNALIVEGHCFTFRIWKYEESMEFLNFIRSEKNNFFFQSPKEKSSDAEILSKWLFCIFLLLLYYHWTTKQRKKSYLECHRKNIRHYSEPPQNNKREYLRCKYWITQSAKILNRF